MASAFDDNPQGGGGGGGSSLSLSASGSGSGCATPKTRRSYSVKPSYERHFRDLEEIGRGRFSVVKKCWNVRESREVAVKFYRRQAEDAIRREFGLQQGLVHRNVIRALDLYKARTGYALVMEFAGAQSIFQYACRRRAYSESTVCSYIRQLCQAVAFLHSQRIIHGDIRPENLMADSSKSPPTLKVIDFGSAAKLDSSSKWCSPILPLPLSAEFSAPELLDKQAPQLTFGADLWSVGVVIYVFLGGTSPFSPEDSAVSEDEVVQKVTNVQYSYPEEYFSEISPDAKSLIDSLLTHSADDRLPAEKCLQASWLVEGGGRHCIPSARLLEYIRWRQRSCNN